MKTFCSPVYHHHSFVAIHAIEHMIVGPSKSLSIYTIWSHTTFMHLTTVILLKLLFLLSPKYYPSKSHWTWEVTKKIIKYHQKTQD